MQHLDTYAKHKLQNIEMFDANLDGYVQHKKKMLGDNTEDVKVEKKLTEAQENAVSDFITKRLVGRVGVVKATERLKDSPVVLADHESAQIRKLFRMTGQASGPAPKYNLHFNPKHQLIRKIYTLSQSTTNSEVETAGLIVEQLLDNALISAGLLEEPRSIITRLNTMMLRMVDNVADPTADQ
uniref:Chaperone protein htpG n=1 Tax=Lygus hesperus TaxID=30085 RepID=A0A0A9X714_LYGHE